MRALPKELEDQIDKYKLWMFDGDQKRIAKEKKMSETMVSLVLNKKAFNKDIVEQAREIAIKNARSMGVELI